MSKKIFLILVILSTTVTTTPTKGVEGEGQIGLVDPRQKLRAVLFGGHRAPPNDTSLTKTKRASTGGTRGLLQPAQRGEEEAEALREISDTTVPSLHLHTTRKVLNEPRDWEQANTEFHNKFDAQEVPHEIFAKSDDFVSIGELGEGAFGLVSKVQKKSNGQVYALKKLQQTGDNEDQLMNEFMLLYALDSKYITKLRYYYHDDDYNVFFVMDYINGIELYKYVSEGKKFSEEDAQYILVDVVLALEYIHKVDCIHHDIKLENILITEKGFCTLIDFGLAKVTYDEPFEEYDTVPGSARYLAPELLKLDPYSELVDCWSFGVLLYGMVLGKFPFKGDTVAERLDAVLPCKLTFPDDADLSDDFKDLITNVLTEDVEKRYDMRRIKEHAWFKKYFNGNESSSQTANPPVSCQ